jgi:hypothetical protein
MIDRRKLDISEAELTEREMKIARQAAKMAVQEITDNFYKDVGKTVVSRWLVLIGAAFVAYAMGKGWISLNALWGGK